MGSVSMFLGERSHISQGQLVGTNHGKEICKVWIDSIDGDFG